VTQHRGLVGDPQPPELLAPAAVSSITDSAT